MLLTEKKTVKLPKYTIINKLTINVPALHSKVSNFKKNEEILEKKSNLNFF